LLPRLEPTWKLCLLCHTPTRFSGYTLGYIPGRTASTANDSQLEQTILHPLEFQGIGLHSGVDVSMRLIPAPAGSGIVFRRSDLDNYEIPATGRNVAKVSYATSLMRQGVLISTTEHLLSALIGLGVDNVIVEIDNLEVPILDGSAQPYVEAILAAGLKGQRRKREYLKIIKDIPSPIGRDTFIGDLEAGDYSSLIAPARTFGFREDEAMLRDMGLIRGATDQCAIIIGNGQIQNGALRFTDEFVRHKVLDLIGDLALAGRRIWGRVVAERAGHAMHTALVQRLLQDRSAWELAHRYEGAEVASHPDDQAEASPLLQSSHA
jgi:UDP-3-O-[3-hydroxymyristoyl] N-acetylglucosamine deacetylase